MRILVIDDDQVIRLQMKTLLAKCGDFEVDCVSRGKIGIAQYLAAMEDKEPYAAVLVDIQLPDISGQEVVSAIRDLEEAKDASASKIIMVTVKTDMKNRAEAFHRLCDEYMTKPFSLDDLKDKLKTVGILK